MLTQSISRVEITPAATIIIDKLRREHGELMFHQSGGCCDGSSPMCFAKGDFLIGSSDVWLGEVHGCDFFMSEDQFEYWKHTQLTIDVTPGRGASFSLEIPLGIRFFIRSRLFELDELDQLTPVHVGPVEA
ncbi:DUF779 domain-containing protein [Larkinella humicola]|uniref:DUF779 domain-containing protein n=1 Tax=Larkinella humicola TaxID=2607654 RepID=A0A5N1JMK6_9BACT|nr:DUF779 domain-containing protein [Larkinella humicola]KAA9357454.1 DUF779 domain-containing protein [Larkinella humicola]